MRGDLIGDYLSTLSDYNCRACDCNESDDSEDDHIGCIAGNNGFVGFAGIFSYGSLDYCVVAVCFVYDLAVLAVVCAFSGFVRNYETDVAFSVVNCLELEFEYECVVFLDSCAGGRLSGEYVYFDDTVVKRLNFGAFGVLVVVVVCNGGEVFPILGKVYYTLKNVVILFVEVGDENELCVVVVKDEGYYVDTVFSSNVLYVNLNGDLVACFIGFGCFDNVINLCVLRCYADCFLHKLFYGRTCGFLIVIVIAAGNYDLAELESFNVSNALTFSIPGVVGKVSKTAVFFAYGNYRSVEANVFVDLVGNADIVVEAFCAVEFSEVDREFYVGL